MLWGAPAAQMKGDSHRVVRVRSAGACPQGGAERHASRPGEAAERQGPAGSLAVRRRLCAHPPGASACDAQSSAHSAHTASHR